MKRKILCLLLCMVMVFSLVACATPDEDASAPPAADSGGEIPVIRYISWTTPHDPRSAPLFDAIADFAEQHSDKFILEHENILGDELKAKIRTDIASNTVPDIFLYWGSVGNSKALLDADVIIPFDVYLNASSEVSRDLFSQESFERTSADGVLTTITKGLHYGVWLCNRELFEEAGVDFPTSLEEMIEIGPAFRAMGITPFAMGSRGGNPAHEFVAELMGQMPTVQQDLNKLNQEFSADSLSFRSALEFIETMRENNLLPSDTIAIGDWGQHFAVYNEGQAAMIYIWTWQLSSISPEMAEKTEIIYAPVMPGATRDVTNYVRQGGDMGEMISKAAWEDQSKRDSIIAIVDFIFSKEMAEMSLYHQGEIPNRLDVEVNPALLPIPFLAEVIEFAKNKEDSPSLPSTVPITEAWTAFADSFDELLAGLITPDEIVIHVDSVMDRLRD